MHCLLVPVPDGHYDVSEVQPHRSIDLPYLSATGYVRSGETAVTGAHI